MGGKRHIGCKTCKLEFNEESKHLFPIEKHKLKNGTSDIDWTRFDIMNQFPDVQFYDYTKVLNRLSKSIPDNYHLTFSKNEVNDEECQSALNLGFNVAVVFSTKKGSPLPESYMGYTVYNGDETDVRFKDPKGVVVGLIAKGDAKKDKTGFVVNVNNL